MGSNPGYLLKSFLLYSRYLLNSKFAKYLHSFFFDFQCLLLLLLYKLVYPQWVFINRGNHESALVNVRHGFQKELLQKYPQDLFLFEFFGELFKWIPVAHLINDKIFVIHGGLPDQPDLKIEDIRQQKYAQIRRQRDQVQSNEMAYQSMTFYQCPLHWMIFFHLFSTWLSDLQVKKNCVFC